MQRVGVTFRLEARDVADIEYYCSHNNKKPSEWFREIVEKELNILRADYFAPEDEATIDKELSSDGQ